MDNKLNNKLHLYYRDKDDKTYSLHINFFEKTFYKWIDEYTFSGFNDKNDIRVYSKKELLEYEKRLLNTGYVLYK